MASEVPFQLSSLRFPTDKSERPSQREYYKEPFAKKKKKILVFTGFIESWTWLWSVYTALTVDSD